MLHLWRRFIEAFEAIKMLPSLLQAVLPRFLSFKEFHNEVKARDSRRDDLNREAKRLFESSLKPHSLLAMSGKLQDQFKLKLQSGNMNMLPSYNCSLPSGHEQGSFLALDVGGSTFRVALVRLNGKEVQGSKMEIVSLRAFSINDPVRQLDGEKFFDWMAERIKETLCSIEEYKNGSNTLPVGLAWSFPIEQTSARSGLLLDMGKGFHASNGARGQDIGELIMRACKRHHLNVRVEAIVNDGLATLLSRAYMDDTTRIALILGTGMNAAIHLPVASLSRSKFGERPDSWYAKAQHVLVNTELSLFGKNVFPTTRWDDFLNANHLKPDFQPFEHLCSGRYIGEIVRLVLMEAISTTGLFNGKFPEMFTEPYSFGTDIVAFIESDDSPMLVKSAARFQNSHRLADPPSYQDLLFIRRICQNVSQRAAAFLATGIHALWSLRLNAEGTHPAKVGPISIGCNGSVIEKYPGFRSRCQSYLDDLTTLSGASPNTIVLELSYESAILGAAVAACCPDE